MKGEAGSLRPGVLRFLGAWDLLVVAAVVALFCAQAAWMAQGPQDAFHVDSLHYLSVSLVMRNFVLGGDWAGLARQVAGEILPNPPLVEMTTAAFLLAFRPATMEACRHVALWSIFPYIALLAFSLYLLTRDLWGRAAGIAAVLACLSTPGIMTAGRYLLMDVPAASLFMLLVLAMYRCDLFGSRPYSLLLGAAFGLGMMAKTSFIIYAAGPLAALLLAAWWRFFPTLQLRTAVALCAVLLLLGAKIGLGAVPTSTALQETGRSHLLFVVLLLACAAAFAAWTAWSRRVSETSGRRWLGPGRAVNLANLLGAVLLCLLICLPLYADNLTVLKTIMSHSHEAGTVMRPPPLSESPYKAIFLQAYSPLNALFFGVGFLASLLVPRLLKKNGLVLAAFPLAVANLLSFTYIDMRYLLPLFPLCALLGASWPALLRWARVPILLVLMAAGLLQMGIFGLAYYHHLDGPNMEGPKAQLVRLGVVRPGFSFYNAYHSGERDKARADAAVAEIFTALTELAAGKPITLVSCFEARSILSYGMMRSYSEVHRLPVTFIDIGHGRGAWPSEIPLQYGVFVVGSDGAAYPNRLVEGLVGAPARTVRLPDQYRALIYAYPAPVPFRILEYTRNPGG